MDSQSQQASERIKQANNILVTVSNNPSVDQLSACIALTIALNKLGKHATAVFSGAVPSTIEFLQPEKTIEKNTDSLRDFIIALDKSKADKLRYKVEDRVVKIFITPYRTSISQKDLEFSQGDFNVDVVLALGVHNQADLDQAITSHGRILHDATIISVNTKPGGELGSINWLDPNASSLSELGVQLIDVLDKKLMDTQISTALLTGIVAETERFSNSRTSPHTMSISAELMAAGANQQLVATKLEEPIVPPPVSSAAPIAGQEAISSPGSSGEEGQAEKKPDDGTLEISHDNAPAAEPSTPSGGEGEEQKPEQPEETPEPAAKEPALPPPPPAPEIIPDRHEPLGQQIHIDEHGSLSPLEDLLPPKPEEPPTISHHNAPPKMVLEPPTTGGQLTATGTPDTSIPSNDTPGLPGLEVPPLSADTGPTSTSSPANPTIAPPITGDEMPSGGAAPVDSFLVSEPGTTPLSPQPAQPPTTGPFPGPNKTLSDIEQDVHSSHLAQPAQPQTDFTPPSGSAPMASDGMLPPLPAPDADTAFSLPTSTGPALPDTSTSQPIGDAAPSPDQTPTVSSARDAVTQAINGSSEPALGAVQALNAQPVNLPMGGDTGSAQPTSNPAVYVPESPVGQMPQISSPQPQPGWSPAPDPFQPPANASPQFPPITLPGQYTPDANPVTNPNAPPPVPPPMMPPANQ